MYAIIVKQNGCGVGEFQIIKSGRDDPISWYFDSSGKRRNPLFRFTLEGSPYYWSCPINIQSIKKSYFVLRNKFNYTSLRQNTLQCRRQVLFISFEVWQRLTMLRDGMDANYFMSYVRKIKQVYRIFIRELNNEEIPYLIKNSTSKYCMIIDNLKIILKPDEESFFASENPSINNKKIIVCLYPASVSKQVTENYIRYEIKVNSFEQNSFKYSDENL